MTIAVKRVTTALSHIEEGIPVIVTGHASEGGYSCLVVAGERATRATIAYMMRETTGPIHAVISNSRSAALDLRTIRADCDDRQLSSFTVPIDHHTVRGRFAADDSAITLRAMADPLACPRDFVRPGRIYPVECDDRGVLAVSDHFNGALDLIRIAGLGEVAAAGLLAAASGSPATPIGVREFADATGTLFVGADDIRDYRLTTELVIDASSTVNLPTVHGTFRATAFRSLHDGCEHLTMHMGDPRANENIDAKAIVHVHRECLSGDTLRSTACACRERLQRSLASIAAEQRGILVYLRSHAHMSPATTTSVYPLDRTIIETHVIRQVLTSLGMEVSPDRLQEILIGSEGCVGSVSPGRYARSMLVC